MGMATVMAMETIMASNTARLYILLILGSLVPHHAMSGEVKASPRVSLMHVHTDYLNIGNQDPVSDQISELKASLNLQSIGSNVEGYLNYEYLQREYADYDQFSDGFDNYNGQLLLKFLDNKFTTLLAAQQGRQQSSLTSPVSEFSLIGLGEVTTYNMTNRLSSHLNDIVNYDIQWRISDTQVDSVSDIEEIDFRNATNQLVNIAFTDGDFFTRSYWSLNASYIDIDYDSEQESQPATQRSNTFSAEIGHGIVDNISIFAKYYDEDYDVVRQSQSLTSSSYGAGLRWNPSSRSYFQMAYNWAQDDLNDNFLSAKLNWQPSSRTSLLLSSSKRFFGDAYEAQFSYRHKRIASNISYTETVQNFQIATLRPSVVGNFICPNTPAFTIDQCRFSAGQTPTVGSGEQLVPVNGFEQELNNTTYLDKNLNASLSYQFRKAKALLTINRSRRTNIEIALETEIEAISLSTSYRLARHHNFNLSMKYTHFDTLSQSASATEYRQQDYDIRYNHSLGRTLLLTVRYNHRQRESNVATNDFDENIVTLSISKEF